MSATAIQAAVDQIVADQVARLAPIHSLSPAARAKAKRLARQFVTKGDDQ